MIRQQQEQFKNSMAQAAPGATLLPRAPRPITTTTSYTTLPPKAKANFTQNECTKR